MSVNLYPMHSIPLKNFTMGASNDHKLFRTLRENIKTYHGFFLVRHSTSNNSAASFVLQGGEYSGRWMLGRIRKHKTQPGRYEIVIRRATTCYYQAVDGTQDLANELRFMALDADTEFSDPTGKWIPTPDLEFNDLGFVTERVHG